MIIIKQDIQNNNENQLAFILQEYINLAIRQEIIYVHFFLNHNNFLCL